MTEIKYSIKIQADASVLFKLLPLKELEEVLNKEFALNKYCSAECKIKELVISLSALAEFSLSVKPNRTEFKAQSKTLVYHVNTDLEYVKTANREEIEVMFLDILLQFLESENIKGLSSSVLHNELMEHFF